MKKYIIIATCLCVLHTKAQIKIDQNLSFNNKTENPIQVLNIGTFHMGNSSDSQTVDFNEHDQDNVRQIHAIAKKIAAFKPTIIIIETPPDHNDHYQKEYNTYLKNPQRIFKNPSEVELLAFEVGRLSNTKNIYGIDHRMGYNYNIASTVHGSKDQAIVQSYFQHAIALNNKFEAQQPTVLERLTITNQPYYLDFLLNVNADLLTHTASKGNFEGADEAAKFYQRNLRMYSNLNQIPMTKDDRILILLGATHTAFFNQWLSRSPKYQLANTLEYLR